MGDDQQARQHAAREHLTGRLVDRPGASLSALAALEKVGVDAAVGGLDRTDIRAALALAPAARAELDAAELRVLELARARGCTWGEIAAELGLSSRQHAQLQYKALVRRVANASPSAPTRPAAPTAPGAPVNGSLTPVPVPTEAEQDDTDVPPADTLALPPALERPPAAVSAPPATPSPERPVRRSRPRAARRRSWPAATDGEAGQDPYDYARTEDGHYRVTYNGQRIGLVVPTWRGAARTKQWEPRNADNTRVALAKPAYPTVKAAAVEVVGAHVRRLDNLKRQRRRRR